MFQIVSWTKTQNLVYIFLNLMELTVADDFQNNLNQTTILDTLSGTEHLLEDKKRK